jgi:hypothetical protein
MLVYWGKKRNTEALIDSSNEVGLEVNTEKTKYMLMSHHQDAGQNTTNRPFENVAKFKCSACKVI